MAAGPRRGSAITPGGGLATTSIIDRAIQQAAEDERRRAQDFAALLRNLADKVEDEPRLTDALLAVLQAGLNIAIARLSGPPAATPAPRPRKGRPPKPSLRHKRASAWLEARRMQKADELTTAQFDKVVEWVCMKDGGLSRDSLANLASSLDGKAAYASMTDDQRNALRHLIARITKTR